MHTSHPWLCSLFLMTHVPVVDTPCELVPQCMYPFPNNFWLREPLVPGGVPLLDFSVDTFPKSLLGEKIDPVAGGWNELDGFSSMAAIHTYALQASVRESRRSECDVSIPCVSLFDQVFPKRFAGRLPSLVGHCGVRERVHIVYRDS
jgi:hypothetical protein